MKRSTKSGLRFAAVASAAVLVGLLPSLGFFLVFQRTLMRGVTLGAVK